MSDADDLLRQVGDRVRNARKAADMTQAELAARIGFTRASVANIERGQQGLTISRLATLANVLSLDVAALIGPGRPVAPLHDVTISHVYEVYCQTCGNLDVMDSHAKARQARADHVAATADGVSK